MLHRKLQNDEALIEQYRQQHRPALDRILAKQLKQQKQQQQLDSDRQQVARDAEALQESRKRFKHELESRHGLLAKVQLRFESEFKQQSLGR